MRRVLLAPLANETRHPRASEQLRRNLAAELQAAGLFELVLPPARELPALSQFVRKKGKYDEQMLVELRRRYNVDGLLVGTLTQYRPYRPLRIGLVLHLISIHDASPVASIDSIWDCRDRKVSEAALQYAEHELLVAKSDRQPELILDSPDFFQRFVSHQVAAAWSVIRSMR